MTPADITAAKSRAIHFFGYDKYEELKNHSFVYFAANDIKVPPSGIEAMPEFWHTIQQIITDETQP